jgi:hypothetical protein
MNQTNIDKILELSKLNYTINDICSEVNESSKDVVSILLENNTNTIIGLKQSITKDLKVIESGKTIDERVELSKKITHSINTMYENFKWVVDNFNQNCCENYNVTDLGDIVDNPTENEIINLIKSIKRDDDLLMIRLDLKFSPNQIIQYIVYINKIRKSTISKRLSKIQSETKKDQRKLIRLDIEDVMNEMYMIYKWMTKEYGYCLDYDRISKEIEEEQLLSKS